MTTVITDVRIPADQFPLGRVLQSYPDVEIELERLVPTGTKIMPLFWVETEHESAVEETLEEDPLVEDIARLTRTPDRILYAVDWGPDVDGLVRALVSPRIDVLIATGTADAWEFRLQFRHRDDLSRFRRDCRELDIDLELLELFNPMMPPEKGPLTSEQKDVLTVASENGYWNVPREVTQAALADLIGLSESTLSHRLREGESLAVEYMLYGPSGEPNV